MFKLLKKKTYLWIASFLLISMALTFFIAYYAYTSLLTKDFMKKQTFLAMQTAQTTKEYILSLEEQTNVLINKNQLPLNLAKGNYYSLNIIHFDNMDFSRIEIYSSDKIITSISSSTDLSAFKSLTLSKIKDITKSSDATWYISSSYVGDKVYTRLLYVRPITYNQEIVGYLTAWVAPTTLERIFSLSNGIYASRTNQIFTVYSAAAIQTPNGLYQCGNNSIDPKSLSTSDSTESKIYGKSYLLQCDLGIQDMTLILLGNAEYFQSYLALIRNILMAVYIIIAVLIIIFLYLFTLKIGSTVNTLYDKMKPEDPKEALE